MRASGGRGGGEGEFCVGWQWVAVVGWQWCDGDGPVVVFKFSFIVLFVRVIWDRFRGGGVRTSRLARFSGFEVDSSI